MKFGRIALVIASMGLPASLAVAAPISVTGPTPILSDFNIGTTSAYVATDSIPGFSAYVSGGGTGTNGEAEGSASYVNYANAQMLNVVRRNTAYGTAQAVTITSQRAMSINYLNTTSDNGYNAFGLTYVNNTGQTIKDFALSFTSFTSTVVNDTSGPDGMTFSYALNAATLADGANFTDVPSFDFSYGASPTVQSGTVSGIVSGLAWTPGSTLTLRWRDLNRPGLADRAVGVDDVSFAAVPEPVSLGLAGVAGVMLLARRRAVR
jgi:hypothetical protein